VIRVPFDSMLASDASRRVSIPRIEVSDPTEPGAMHVAVTADPDIVLQPVGSQWSAANDPSSNPSNSTASWLEWTGDDRRVPPELVASALPIVEAPRIVVPRMLLRSILEPSGQVRTTAWLALETEQRYLDVSLPEGARWVRAWVGRDALRQ